MPFARRTLEEFAARERAAFEDLLREFVEVPSVSAAPAQRRIPSGDEVARNSALSRRRVHR